MNVKNNIVKPETRSPLKGCSLSSRRVPGSSTFRLVIKLNFYLCNSVTINLSKIKKFQLISNNSLFQSKNLLSFKQPLR